MALRKSSYLREYPVTAILKDVNDESVGAYRLGEQTGSLRIQDWFWD